MANPILREAIKELEYLEPIRKTAKPGTAVPTFKLREKVTIKGYVFKVMLIKPGLISLKPVGPVD